METNTADRILDIIERETGVRATLDSSFESLGIDSLDFLGIIQTVREEIGPLSLRKATDAQTVRDLAAAIED